MQNKENWSTWLEIDLGAIEKNVRFLHQYTGVEIMAIVKANGYGHGAVPTAQAAIRGGATWFGVARIEEALELRTAHITQPVLVFGYTPPGKFRLAIENDISLTIWNQEQLKLASVAALQLKRKANIHLKVDTGMSRLGVQVEDGLKLAQQIVKTPAIEFEGIFTHFARADESDPTPTDIQEASFGDLIKKVRDCGITPKVIHAANSAASLTRPETYYDLVRSGILIYGLDPSDECPAPQSFRPALSWKSVISHIKTLPAGRGVGYGHEYITSRMERIGTVPVGYADGYRRIAKNFILVAGERVPVVGRICMDQMMIQLDKINAAHVSDEVTLLGSQGSERISAEELGSRWHTNNYEVVCGIGPRVPRIYV